VAQAFLGVLARTIRPQIGTFLTLLWGSFFGFPFLGKANRERRWEILKLGLRAPPRPDPLEFGGVVTKANAAVDGI
jgi:hypothetical protein